MLIHFHSIFFLWEIKLNQFFSFFIILLILLFKYSLVVHMFHSPFSMNCDNVEFDRFGFSDIFFYFLKFQLLNLLTLVCQFI